MKGLLDRDLGMGDTWHAPLPNGYQIMMIDVTDQGWIYRPKTQRSSGVVEQGDAISGVRFIQVAQHHVLGAKDSKALDHLGANSDRVDGYFILDTLGGKRIDFPDLADLITARVISVSSRSWNRFTPSIRASASAGSTFSPVCCCSFHRSSALSRFWSG